jgi:hypothetical protein
MSFTDAPIPNTGDAKFAYWREGVDENVRRLDARSLGRGDIVVPTTAGQLNSGYVTTGVDSTSFTTAYVVRSRKFYRDCIVAFYAVSTPSGAAAQVRLRLPDIDLNTSTLTIPSSSTVGIAWRWEHEQVTDEVGGEPMELHLQIRRSSGSGTVQHFNPGQITFAVASLIEESATNGGGEIL